MKDLLNYIVENIIDGSFEISEEKKDDFILLNLKVNKEEIGKVIGKNGRTVNSIKNLLRIKAIKDNLRLDIQVQEA